MYQGPERRLRAAAWWLAGQGAALVVVTCWLLFDLVAGHATEASRGLGVVAVAVCAALGAGALSWALMTGRRLARTPTLLWHGLMVLVGLSISSSGAPPIGVAMIVIGVIGFVLGLRVPPADRDQD